MAKTCPACGTDPYQGNFCGQCGAPLSTPAPTPAAPIGQPTPPPVQEQATSSMGQSPVYGQPPVGQPTPYGQPSPYGQPTPYHQPSPYGYPLPPRKSGTKTGVLIGVIAVVVVLAVLIWKAMAPTEEVVTAPAPPPANSAETTKPEQKPAEKPPEKSAPATGPKQTAVAGVTQLASGQIETTFDAFDWHSSGMLSVASSDGSHVRLMLYDYLDGRLAPAFEIIQPMGALRDVVFGDLRNEDENRAILVTEKGLLLVDREGEWEEVPQTGVDHVYIGDWDGDGQEEMAAFVQADGKPVGLVTRFSPGKDPERLGQFEVAEFPHWPAQTFLTLDKRRMLLGVNDIDDNTKEVLLYTLDPATGLVRNRAQRLSSPWSAPLIGAGAGMLGGKPTLVATYKASPSYMELFDITADGYVSRGTVSLPDDGEYYPILGQYSGDALEVMAITPEGKWMLFGFN